jgi:hypothetical protein
MASRRSRPRRFLLPILLAAVLAAEITGLALARSLTPPPSPAPVAAAVADPASTGTAPKPATKPAGAVVGDAAGDTDEAQADQQRTRPIARVATPPAFGPASAVRVAKATTRPKTSPSSASYRGSNHVWIPSLGIDKSVQLFPCTRNRPPDAGAYRWGCAGRNNVYLLAHAWSTFKPLHDAYVGGRLKKGMKVVYGDGAGRVHTYSVIWWKVVAPTTAASWAWASLSTPSMTLQTCVGSKSQYRLMVRLVQGG